MRGNSLKFNYFLKNRKIIYKSRRYFQIKVILTLTGLEIFFCDFDDFSHFDHDFILEFFFGQKHMKGNSLKFNYFLKNIKSLNWRRSQLQISVILTLCRLSQTLQNLVFLGFLVAAKTGNSLSVRLTFPFPLSKPFHFLSVRRGQAFRTPNFIPPTQIEQY